MGRLSAWRYAWPLLLLAAGPTGAEPSRVAYFYHYMGAAHLDSLAGAGFDGALIHWIPDTLGTGGARELQAFVARGQALGIEVVPEWSLQQPSRLSASPALRRYTWGVGLSGSSVPCPLDSAYWRSALLKRADEMLAAAPGTRRLAVDLELWQGTLHHWDAGPCRCAYCIAEYGETRPGPPDARRLAGLLEWEEATLELRLAKLLREFARHHPGVELGVLDLDYASFVHRALARALVRAGLPTADWCERSYSAGAGELVGARTRLQALGLPDAPLRGGLWLKQIKPADLPNAVRAVRPGAQGWFAFTTYSLWLDPTRLAGPYALAGTQEQYWKQLKAGNAQ